MDYNEVANAMEFPRGNGKTTAICVMARDLSATVIAHCQQEARRLEKEYGVKAISVEQCAALRGRKELAFMDNHAVYHLIQAMDAEISHWKSEATLKRQIINSIKNILPN